MELLQLTTVTLAGITAGAIPGAFLSTETEMRIRQRRQRGSMNVYRFLRYFLSMIVGMAAIGIVAIGILRLGGAYPLNPNERYLLGGCILLGAASAKVVRFLYWRRRESRVARAIEG